MNLSDIITKCYILALIIRDDGERLLLGDGNFEFKSSLQHFAPNIYQNDVVELQGTDGQLLAGQVRRSATQAFDGYITDATIGKTDTEQSRRRFLGFFRKKHHYKVVYIMPDGTAVQRNRGYIVDAPAVQELYQLFPEYHIGLNFEDPNYYEYTEDESGDEIYTHIQAIALFRELEAGLVWDAFGAVSDDIAWIEYMTKNSADGYILIGNGLPVEAPLSLTHLYGNAEQNGTPTPDAPIPVNVVSGAQTVKITGKNLFDKNAITSGYLVSRGIGTLSQNPSYGATDFIPVRAGQTIHFGDDFNRWYSAYYDTNKVAVGEPTNTTNITIPNGVAYLRTSLLLTNLDTAQLELGNQKTDFEPYQAQSHTIDLDTLELAKIGDYQDYIYESGDKWYKHAEVGKVVCNGNNTTEAWTLVNSGTDRFYYQATKNVFPNTAPDTSGGSTCSNLISNMGQGAGVGNNNTYKGIMIITSTGNCRVRYGTEMAIGDWRNFLASHNMIVYTPLATPTDTEITDSELIAQLNHIYELYQGTNNLWLIPSAGAQGEMTVRFGVAYDDDGSGYHWSEELGSPDNIISNDGIDSVRPIWIINGPATNPTLTNITTAQTIAWNGTVPADSTLTIDMERQTATLNGANVYAQIEGDWLELAVGPNKLQYTASGGATADSTLEWNGVAG